MRQNFSVATIIGLVLSVFVASPAVPEERAEESSPESNFRVQVVDLSFELESDPAGVSVDSGEWYVLKSATEETGSSFDENWEVFGSGQLSSSTLEFPAVDDGFYLLEINPSASFTPKLTSSRFYVDIQSGVATVTEEDSGTSITNTNGVFTLPIREANITGNLLNPDGSAVQNDFENGVSYIAEVLENYGDGFYPTTSAVVDDNGEFSLYVADGEYKLRFRVFGRSDVAGSTTESFIIAGNSKEFLDQSLVSPLLTVAVRSANGSENLQNVSIQLLKDQSRVDSFFTGSSGVVAISLAETGTYELQIEPAWGTTGNSRNSYELVVSGSAENLSAQITDVSEDADGFHILRFKVPTISGQVLTPDGSEGVAFAEVLPTKVGDIYPDYEYAAFTDGEGNYSMALPEGSYNVVAKAPWDSSDYGDGLKVGPVDVDSSGVATSLPPGMTTDAFNLNLSDPTWSGIVVSPLDNQTPIEGVSVCLQPSMFSMMSSCSRTDEDGKFALSAPEDFDGFDEGSRLTVEKWDSQEFSAVTLDGTNEVEAALGSYSAGDTYTNINLTLGVPNFEISVETPNGDPAARVWVNLQSNFNYIGGKETDANGIARFTLTDEDRASDIYLQMDLWGNPQLNQEYTATNDEIQANSLTADGDGMYSFTATLDQPNFRAIIRKPVSSEAVANTGVEVQSLNDYNWLNSNQSGVITANLKPASSGSEYLLKVRPPWDSSDNLSANEYSVEVAADGSITSVTELASETSASTESVTIGDNSESVYVFELKQANVTGRVVENTDGIESGVRDSWIEIREDVGKNYLWDKSTNSKLDGNFGVSLDDGDYELIANAPWYSSKVKSAACDVAVSSGAVDANASSTDCVDGNGDVTLSLREGNLKLNLLAPDGDPLPNANVSVSVGNWHTWAQSGSDGVASLFIDDDEIKLRNYDWASAKDTADDLPIRFWFDPPWGQSGMSGWECSTADAGLETGSLCDVLDPIDVTDGFTVPTGALDVSFPSPNTVITVTDGTDAVGVGAWVSIYALDANNNRFWVDGSQTDYDGKAYFNVDDTSAGADYLVEVNPPWNQEQQLTRAEHELNGDQLDSAELSLKTPNLFLDIDAKDGTTAAKWSWVQLEKVDSSNYSFISWENGAGANRAGQAALALDASATYKLTIYPGSPSAGARTTCIISTDSSSVVSLEQCANGAIDGSDSTKLNIDLAAGNVSGKVLGDSGDLSGVIVSAQSVSLGEVAEAVTDSDGTYELQLDIAKDWKISFYYSGENSSGVPYLNEIDEFTFIVDGSTQEQLADVTLTLDTQS